MAKRKQPRYTHPGGVLGVPRRVIRSPAYRDLSLAARCLMLELQDVWQPSEPVIHYSSRRAATALNASRATAARAFHELTEHGLIQPVTKMNSSVLVPYILSQSDFMTVALNNTDIKVYSSFILLFNELIENDFPF